LNITFL